MALDFSFSPEQESVRESVRRFCQEEIEPLVRQAEETETFPRELAADIEAARWLVYYGAWCVDQNRLTPDLAAKVKRVANETAVRASESAIRIFGGAGIMREYPVGRIHRDALLSVIGEGTSDIQRNLIARGLDFKA